MRLGYEPLLDVVKNALVDARGKDVPSSSQAVHVEDAPISAVAPKAFAGL